MNANRHLSLILFSILAFSGCTTAFMSTSEKEWLALKEDYVSQCRAYQKAFYEATKPRNEKEEYMKTDVLISKRCLQEPEVCKPPRKSQDLIYYERTWGKNFTPDFCLDRTGFYDP